MSNQASETESIVRSSVGEAYAPSADEEVIYKSGLDDYAPIDPTEIGENDIGFNFLMYPTLHRMALDESRV